MDYNHQIANLAIPLLGTLTEQQRDLLPVIVDAVQAELAGQLRKDVDPADCVDSFVVAAMLLVVSMMRKLDASDISDFTAGTLKVSLRDDQSYFTQMADRLLAPWRADAIAFRGVSG